VKNGMISLNSKPGLGIELLPELHLRADAIQKTTTSS
jgi:galactonate dehydratase